jgi:hypothetical protein
MRPLRGVARGATLLLALCGGALAGCRGGAEAPPAEVSGDYVVLADSSSVHVLFLRDGNPVVGTFPGVLGAVQFEEDVRRLMLGKGEFTLDLGSVLLPDTAQAGALARDVFQINANREFRTARLSVRQLFGKSFTTLLPVGAVTPVTARAQLVIHGMAVSRDFDGEISRAPGGYRITTVVPLLVSLRQLGMDDEVAAGAQATGGGTVGDVVVVTVDLRLARRAPVRDAPAQTRS